MLDAGLRVSEAIDLRLDNLDWETQTLRLIGKGGKEAELPISERLRDVIEKALQIRPIQTTHNHLIWDRKNPTKPITRQAVNVMLKRYKEKAGIQKKVYPHLLRHTFATELLRTSRDLGRTQAALRHSSPSTTAIYTHLDTEDLREDLNSIVRRPWFSRMLSRMKPLVIPDILKKKPKLLSTSETIGREKELDLLKKNRSAKVNTIIVGETGMGRRHLLRVIEDEHCYTLDTISPPRESLLKLCQVFLDKGLLDELPKGRSVEPFIEAVVEVGGKSDAVLVISSINDMDKRQIGVLRKLKISWTIFSSIDRSQKGNLRKTFFGDFEAIELENLDKKSAIDLARKLASDLSIQNQDGYFAHIWNESQGNPLAILELVEVTRRKGEERPIHEGVNKVLAATIFLSAFMIFVLAGRYSAGSLDEPTLKIWAVIIIFASAPFFILDKILKMKDK